MKSQIKLSLTFIFLIILTVSNTILAQETYSGSIKDSLQQVIITASKKEISINALPISMHYISSKEIESRSSIKIDESLQNIAGINVQRPFGIFGKSVVGIRGIVSSEPGRQLTLINGTPINKSDGGTVNWNRINPLTIDHIEVIKGPGSLLYGSNAMGGIINLITKKPTSENLSGQAKAYYGTYNTINAGFMAGQTNNTNTFYYQISGQYLDSDGYITVPENLRDTTDIAVFTKQQSIEIETAYNLNKRTKIKMNYQFYDDHNGQGRKIYLEEGQTTDHDTHFLQMDFQTFLDQTNLTVQGFYQKEKYLKNMEKLKNKNYTLINVSSNRMDYGGVINLNRQINNHQINIGTNIRLGSVDAADIYQTATDKVVNQGKQDNIHLYFQDQYKINEHFLTLVGMAFHTSYFHNGLFKIDNPTYNTAFMLDDTGPLQNKKWQDHTYSLGVQYNFDTHRNIYINMSKAFRTPGLDDLTRSGFINIGYKRANPDLEPEKVWNYEMGGRFTGNKWQNNFSVFYSLGKEFMYYMFTGESLFGGRKKIYQKNNITQVSIKGFEWEFHAGLHKNWSMGIGYSFNHATIIDYKTQPELNGKKLSYVPKHIFNASLKFHYKKWDLATFYTLKSKMYTNDKNTEFIPALHLIDARVKVLINHRMTWELKLNNLLDKQYMVSNDQLSIGRFITTGFNLDF
jgi:iron complex outermembrane receptor protein